MRSRAVTRIAATGAAIALGCAGAIAPASADVAGQSREAVITQYQSVLLPALRVANDWTGSVSGCNAGTTSAAYQDATLTALNYVRGLVSQPAVTFDPSLHADAQAAALIMAAQDRLSHYPPASWACWTSGGSGSAGRSNLHLGRSGAFAIISYMEDSGENNLLAGHRRWLLDSRATAMATGDTSKSNVITVIGSPRRPSSGTWIPWPAPGFFPWQLEPKGRWSLGLPGAGFQAASVAVSVSGAPVAVAVTPTIDGYGDNTISWDMSLPQPARTDYPSDMNVDVTVSGIRLGDGSTVNHSYTVTLIDAAPHPTPSHAYFIDVKRNARGLLASWEAPVDDGGEAITYLVTAAPDGKAGRGLPTRTCTTSLTTCQLTQVSRKVGYTVTITVRNSVGISEPDTFTIRGPGR
ncbi:MAG: hypothetical protein F2836_03455 [Actinobacteria bacterium]|uniref:Unannotated protein n=1 Tax=freshwater metagenome TaxID=449393 RepID=A0A6J7IIG3_9ZZZZ|nr:hypothetical protein [Actinomycetota bacterium]